jgi:hypothetical protein
VSPQKIEIRFVRQDQCPRRGAQERGKILFGNRRSGGVVGIGKRHPSHAFLQCLQEPGERQGEALVARNAEHASTRNLVEKLINGKRGCGNQKRIPGSDEGVADQLDGVVGAVGKQDFVVSDSEISRQGLAGGGVFGVTRQRLGGQRAAQRTDHFRGAAHRILVEVEAEFSAAPFERRAIFFQPLHGFTGSEHRT